MIPSPSLFLERYGARAQERLAQLIADAKGDNPLLPVTVVVPTIYTGLSLRRSLGKETGLANVRFVPVPRLAEYLGAPYLAEQRKSPLSNIMKLAAIRHFAPQMAVQGPLGAIATQPPLHNYLVNTFSDLSILHEDGLSRLESKSPLLKQVTAWYRLYRSLVTDYYDREDLANAAADVVTEGKAKSALQDLGFIIFYLVARYSPGELLMVSNLRKSASCAVVLGLTGEEEVDTEARGLAARLEPIFDEAIVRNPVIDSCSANHILIAPDAHEEIRWVLRHICQNAEEGIPFHRMAVLYRNAETYASLIKTQLALAGIPAAGTDPLPLRDTPAGKLLVYMLDVFESDFARETVMHWIAEAPVGIGGHGEFVSRESAMWEIISGKAGIVKGIDQWRARLGSFCRGMDEMMESAKTDKDEEQRSSGYFESRKLAAIHLKSFVEKLASSPPPPDGNWKTYAEWTGKLLKEFAYLEAWPEEHRQSYEKVVGVIEELAELDAVEPGGTTLAGFHQMVDDCLRAASGRLGPTGTGVFTASVGAAQGMDFDSIYILGMAEGAFPPALPEDAFIPDNYREELMDFGFLPLQAARRTEERRLFRAALAAGQKRFLSYPRAGTGGQRRGYPSPWLVKEAELLHEKAIKATAGGPSHTKTTIVSSTNLEELDGEPWLSVVHSTQHSVQSLGGLVPADIHDYDMHSLSQWHAAGGRLEGHFLAVKGGTAYRALQMEQARRGNLFTAWDGNITALVGKSQRLRVPQNRYLSPTRLELWAKCPFCYYLGHVLEVSILEAPEEIMTISALDRGHLMHTILERFIRATQETVKEPGYGEPWVEHHQKLLIEIAEEEFKTAESLGITGKPLMWSLAQYEMREDLLTFLIKDSKLRSEMVSRPQAVECRFGFGENDQYSPVVLTLPSGHKISFRGIIDRVDANISGSRLLVLDYKTGGTYSYKDMKDDPLGAGKHLQLPIYALAVRNHFGDQCEIQVAYWFATSKGNFELKTVELTDTLESRFREMIDLIVASISAGIFLGNPGSGGEDYNNCTYCDYRRICPADPSTAWEKKSQNPELEQYTRLAREPAGEEEAE